MEGTLDFILQELRNINGRFNNLEEGQAALNERFGDIEKRVDGIEAGQAALNERFGNIEKRVDGIEAGQAALNERFGNIEKRVDGIEAGQAALNERFGNIEARVGNIEGQVASINGQVGDIDSELKAFRIETRTSLQVIHTGQQGVREEMTQRFKETKNSLQTIQKDTELTYQKIALYDLKFNRLESMIDKK